MNIDIDPGVQRHHQARDLNAAGNKRRVVLEGGKARPILQRDRPDGAAPQFHFNHCRHGLALPLPRSRSGSGGRGWMARREDSLALETPKNAASNRQRQQSGTFSTSNRLYEALHEPKRMADRVQTTPGGRYPIGERHGSWDSSVAV